MKRSRRYNNPRTIPAVPLLYRPGGPFSQEEKAELRNLLLVSR